MSQDDNQRIVIGKFGRPHGTHGEVRFWSYNDASDLLGPGLKARIDDPDAGERVVKFTAWRWTERFAIVKVKGVFRRDMAEGLRNLDVFLMREELPDPDPDEFYLVDTIGWPVFVRVEERDTQVGALVGYMDGGACEILRVELESGDQILAPMLDHVVLEMAPEGERVVIADPRGWMTPGDEEAVLELLEEVGDE